KLQVRQSVRLSRWQPTDVQQPISQLGENPSNCVDLPSTVFITDEVVKLISQASQNISCVHRICTSIHNDGQLGCLQQCTHVGIDPLIATFGQVWRENQETICA